MSEKAAEKARRLLADGRVIVRQVGCASHPGRIVAECRGDSGMIYRLGWDPRAKEWRCSCPGRGDNCSHLVALKLVTVRS